MDLTLVSHPLCPYVQRAAIVLHEKGARFERRWVDLAAKPGWFNAISPLGKTPVLLADGEPVFESAVICEYLDETLAPRLHPDDALLRARHRGWMEFGSSVLNTIWAYYTAPDAPALQAQRELLEARFAQLEQALPAGPVLRRRGLLHRRRCVRAGVSVLRHLRGTGRGERVHAHASRARLAGSTRAAPVGARGGSSGLRRAPAAVPARAGERVVAEDAIAKQAQEAPSPAGAGASVSARGLRHAWFMAGSCPGLSLLLRGVGESNGSKRPKADILRGW